MICWPFTSIYTCTITYRDFLQFSNLILLFHSWEEIFHFISFVFAEVLKFSTAISIFYRRKAVVVGRYFIRRKFSNSNRDFPFIGKWMSCGWPRKLFRFHLMLKIAANSSVIHLYAFPWPKLILPNNSWTMPEIYSLRIPLRPRPGWIAFGKYLTWLK